MNKDWFQKEKNTFFKKERKDLLKGKPKKDSSGGGMRLNKGRGGCPITKQKKYGQGQDEFTPERALKIVGSAAMLGVGIHLAKEIID